MAKDSSHEPSGRMNRRQMLGTTALIGGVVAAVTGDAIGQEKSKAATSSTSATGPNLSPPIVQTTCGKLRGLREGKTLSFLGVRYAEAELVLNAAEKRLANEEMKRKRLASGELGLDMYDMRGALAAKGLKYV